MRLGVAQADAKLLWFAAVLVALSGYVFVFRSGEARVEERRGDAARTMARIRAAEDTLAERPQLEAERRRMSASLRHVDLDANTTQLVTRFVHDAARIASLHHVAFVSIAASGPVPPSTDAAHGTAPFSVATVALDCSIEGRYADVLAALRALSATRVLAAVDLTSLARRNAEAADATISAALHVVLERLAPAGLTDVRPRSV